MRYEKDCSNRGSGPELAQKLTHFLEAFFGVKQNYYAHGFPCNNESKLNNNLSILICQNIIDSRGIGPILYMYVSKVS